MPGKPDYRALTDIARRAEMPTVHRAVCRDCLATESCNCQEDHNHLRKDCYRCKGRK